MTTPRPLHAVSADAAGDPDAADAAEARAVAEVARARSELPTLEPAALDCYLGRLVGVVAEHTEADPVAVLASLLCTAGVYLGQAPHVRAGDDRHPLLIWPLIVGKTSVGRKGASWATARRLVAAADTGFLTTNVKSGLTSGEGLANMFTDDTTTPANGQNNDDPRGARAGGLPAGDRRLLVFEPEWAAVMARMRREGNSLSATLRAAWEGGDLSTLSVAARIAPSSHVGLLAHITPDEFRAKVSASDMAGGTYNRFLPLAVARSQFLPLSTGADPALVHQLGASLAERLDQGMQVHAIGFTGAAATLWRELYVEFGSDHGDTGPVEQFISRAAPNCLRIAAIHAALDRGETIDTNHLQAAAALVRYSIATARTVFSNNPTLARLDAWIRDAGQDGRTRKQITTDFFGGHKKAAEITTLLDQLVEAGRITRNSIPPASGRGRATELYTARAPNHANNANVRT